MWSRSDLTLYGLNRGLVHGDRPNHIVIGAADDGGFFVTSKRGQVLVSDLAAWASAHDRPCPTVEDLAWLRDV